MSREDAFVSTLSIMDRNGAFEMDNSTCEYMYTGSNMKGEVIDALLEYLIETQLDKEITSLNNLILEIRRKLTEIYNLGMKPVELRKQPKHEGYVYVLQRRMIWIEMKHHVRQMYTQLIYDCLVHTQKMYGVYEHSKECCICLDTIDPMVMYGTKCKHFFHEMCLQRWKQTKESCPLCRN